MTQAFTTRTCDLLLQGGRIVDGTGRPAFEGDVAIDGDRILATGDCAGYVPRRCLGIDGLHVCPGFIDAHTHDDQLLFDDPTMRAKASQGVTTVVIGNCGVSLAPLVRREVPAPLTEMGDVFRFASFAEYLSALRDTPPALNHACLVGHTTLRVGTMPDLGRRATTMEIDAMRRLCAEALDAGAIGISSGVFYPPARAADWSEVAALAELAGARGGIYATHLRDEGEQIIAAIDEAARIARHAGTPLVLSHHKVAGRANAGRSRESLAHIEALSRTLAVGFDVYPYCAGSSMLSESLHAIATRTVVTWSSRHPGAAGRDLAEVAREMGLSEREAIAELLPAGAIYFLMDEDDVRRILAHPDAMIGSDGISSAHPHPRLWGTFTRVLGHYARDVGLMTLEEAVRRMTSLPAARFGFADRGRIAAGCAADLVVLDAARVADLATYEDPCRPSAGIHTVLVGGRAVWADGASTGERPGRQVLRQGMQGTSTAHGR